MSAEQRGPSRSQRILIEACLELGVAFWWRGPGSLLISVAGILAVLRVIEGAGERAIGLEGFEMESEQIHPRIDLIYDAGIAWRGGAAAVAAEWGVDVWVDVSLGVQAD